MFTDVLPD